MSGHRFQHPWVTQAADAASSRVARSGSRGARALGAIEATRPILDAARSWNDPRRKAERKRRRVRRRARIFGAASGSTGVATMTVAATSAPDWLIVGGTGTTVLLGIPAVAAVAAYRRLRTTPLPPSAPARRALPPVGSAARAPVERLAASERSLHELLGILTRSGVVASEDVDDTARIAAAASASLTAVAHDIVAMERAAVGSTGAAVHLSTSITSTAARLADGVQQYDGLVAAAALLTTPGASGSLSALDSRRDALQFASDRLEGWAYGLERLQRP